MGEENAAENNRKKRDRDDSNELVSDQHESKRVHPCSTGDSYEVDVWKPTSPGSSVGEIDELGHFYLNNRIPEDILDSIDDVDNMPANQDLDSVIRSFEEEILQSSPSSVKPAVTEIRSDSGEYPLDLGYLLEASDDELGLPPTDSTSTEEHPRQDPVDPLHRNDTETADLDDMLAFKNELPRYDSFEFELGVKAGEVDNTNGGFATVDGLFEYFEPLDLSNST